MFNRRHLRIKILQALYAYEQSDNKEAGKGETELFHSIERMYDMYLYLLQLYVELRDVAIQRIEEGQKKHLPTHEDLHPNTRFVANKFIRQLAENKAIKAASEKHKINWQGEGELMKRLFKMLVDAPEYQSFMAIPKPTYDDDQEVVVRTFRRHLVNHPALHEFFEERSIYWVDDLDIVASMTYKTLKLFKADTTPDLPLLPLWKEGGEEKDFVTRLFRKVLAYNEEHAELIHKQAENWEVDRIAVMDIILMKMAMTEVREFPEIPVKVTLNEYIELAKYYSTPKSSMFINGVLDKLFESMQQGGKFKKVGRGLIT
jgi:N utilization substance protein B